MKKNKSTKTILSLFLTLVLAFTCMIPAFADEPECDHSDTRIETIEKPADCTHYYSKEVKTICNDCGECIEDVITIGNKYYHAETETTEIHEKSTCVKVGRDIVWVRCTLCGATVYRTEKQRYAIAHIDTSECYETKIEETPATCTEDGHRDTVVWCNECDVEVSRETEPLAATGHKWSEWKEQNGKKIRTCSVCEAKEEKVVENPQTEDNTPPIVRVVRNIVNTFRNIFTRLFSLFKK